MNSLSRALAAFPTLLRIGFAEAVAYRAELVVWMLTTTMPLVSLALWSAVAASQNAPVGPFTQKGFAAYFLMALVVRQLSGSWLVWELNMEIRTGTLSRRLLKPIHPLVAYSAENIAAIPLRALISVPIAVLAFAAIEQQSILTSPRALLVFFASLLGAWLINFFTMALIGSLAFYIENSTAVFEIWMVAFMLLSGYLIPLDLFPPALRELTRALPFRYTLAFPAETAMGLLSPERALFDLGVQWLFAAVSAAAALLVFRSGVRRFSAFGG